MIAPRQDFQKFLDEQRADYQRALPEKTAQIHALWGAVRPGAEAAAALTELERLAQRSDIALAIAALQASLPID